MIPRRDVAPPAICSDIGNLVAQFYALADKDLSESLFCSEKNTSKIASNFSQTANEKAVQQVLDYIGTGDVYQVNLSQRLQVPFSGDSYTLLRHLYQQNPAPFFAYIQAGDHQIVSTSPERFLFRSGSRIEARPIRNHATWKNTVHHTNWVQNHRAIICLSGLTGNFDAPGGNRVVPESWLHVGCSAHARHHEFTFPSPLQELAPRVGADA